MTPNELRAQTQKLIADSAELVQTSTEYAEKACLAWASGNFVEHYTQVGEQTAKRLDEQYRATQQAQDQ